MWKHQALKIYNESQYIPHGLQLLETLFFLETNSQILQLLMQLHLNLRECAVPYLIGHLRSHCDCPDMLLRATPQQFCIPGRLYRNS